MKIKLLHLTIFVSYMLVHYNMGVHSNKCILLAFSSPILKLLEFDHSLFGSHWQW